MPPISDKEFSKLSSLFQLIITILGAIGALAGIFYLMGNLVLISFLSRLNLYGIVTFKVDFFKEALMALILYMFSPPYIMLIITLVILLICFVPGWIASRIPNTLAKRLTVVTIVFAVVCFVFILPIYYGHSQYDIEAFSVEQIEPKPSDTVLAVLRNTDNPDSSSVLYIFSHTSNKEVLFDASQGLPPKSIIVDKNLIRGIKLGHTSARMGYKLRDLFLPPVDAGPDSLVPKNNARIKLDSSEFDQW